MAICGLVITLSRSDEERPVTVARLRAEPALTLGEPQGPRLPAVLEVRDRAELRERWERLLDTPGVTHVDLAFAGVCPSQRYTLTVDPGAEGEPYTVFENKPWNEIAGDS